MRNSDTNDLNNIENFDSENFAWVAELNLAITVTDLDDNIIYANEKSKSTFPDMRIGDNLHHCHQKSSNEIIRRLKDENTSNTYTVQKNGIKKLIHQTPWYLGGKVSGLVEFSIELPAEMEHRNRDA